jgi:hypothetical protein
MMRRIGSMAPPKKLEHYFPPDTRLNATLALEPAASSEILAGTVLGIITASGKVAAYADANANGTQTARYIAVYSYKTDAQGRVYLGEDDSDGDLPTSGFEAPRSAPTVEVYYGGWFEVSKLIGLDAAAIADLGGRLHAGGTLLHIPT